MSTESGFSSPLGFMAESRVGFRTYQVMYAGVAAAILVTLVGSTVEEGIQNIFDRINFDGGMADGSQDLATWLSRLIVGPVGVFIGLGILGLLVRGKSRWRFGRKGPAVADRFLH